MPVTPTYPGVYIEEIKSSVRTIVGVPTSTTAFVGPVAKGPAGKAKHISNWGDFVRLYGDLDAASSPLAYAVYQFYLNGGAEAEVVRIAPKDAEPATLELGNTVVLTASSPGKWAESLQAMVDWDSKDLVGVQKDKLKETRDKSPLWNLRIRDQQGGTEERFLNIDSTEGSPDSLDRKLAGSLLVKPPAATAKRPPESVEQAAAPPAPPVPAPAEPPEGPAEPAPAEPPAAPAAPTPKWIAAKPGKAGGAGNDGKLTAEDYIGNAGQKTGMHALRDADIFNLMIVSPETLGEDPLEGVLDEALKLCVDRRAILLVDPPKAWTSVDSAFDGIATSTLLGDNAKNAAVYFPRLTLPDPAFGGTRDFAPAGAVAGVITRTDSQRGVWKAPAGTDASIASVRKLSVALTDQENGRLNPRALNVIRTFPIIGTVVWGARTLRGADQLGDEWKYLPVRRMALYLEETLFRSTTWAVFEPNAEPLWSSLRLNIGAFMNSLWRQGAFAGSTARDAYLVKCDSENNPQNDIDRGIVNILVGFAPLKPAEFVLIHIQQLAGELET